MNGPLEAQKGPKMLSILQNFLSPTPSSVKGFLNPEELYRSILTALGSATSVGVLLVLLQAILTNVATIFPNPTVASLATGLLSLVIDLLRRQNQGGTPTPSPAPAPASN